MKKQPRALLIVSGSGVYDGSEIHETTLLLLALDQAGYEVHAAAPNVMQQRVVDHFSKKSAPEKRNALSEAARIMRGNIVPLDSLTDEQLAQYDVLVLPGGLGAATTLSNYALEPQNLSIEPSARVAISFFLSQKKPILATCIAPVLIAQVAADLGKSCTLTLGENAHDAAWLQSLGMTPVKTTSESICVDSINNIITTPAYMNPVSIATIWTGISRAVAQLQIDLKK